VKTSLSLIFALLLVAGALAGCGPSREEIERRERARLEQEKEAQRAIQKSNEAVNEVSKKLGRKPPTLDLGVSTQTQPATPPPTQPKP
jgi:hypothetical protein